MRISYEKPPIYEEADKLFKIAGKKVLFTYGDILYNPEGAFIPPDLFAHEETHARQQMGDPVVAKLWWQRYFADPEFRLDQEVEAYAEQYKFYCRNEKDRNKRFRFLNEIGEILSSEMYGDIVINSNARQLVKKRSGIL